MLPYLTPPERAELDRLIGRDVEQARAAQTSLAAYVMHTYPGRYDMQPHHELIIDHLEAVERGDILRLMVSMPPQRGKSELVSVRLPAWAHGRHPDWKVMIFSHTASLAEDFSRQVREQVDDEDWPFPAVRLRHGQKTVKEWGIDRCSGRHFAAGVCGGGTGKGAHLAIIDDPFKDDREATSPIYRDRVYQWYGKVVRTRMAHQGRIVLIHTRWHEDDLAGRLQNDAKTVGADQWTVLNIPEMAMDDEVDVLGRAPGEALWPARFPATETESIRLTMPHVWWPLYQQRPQALAGGMVRREWFGDRYAPEVLPQFSLVIQAVDSAFHAEVSADFSVIATWGATATHLYLLDIWRDRVEYPDLIKAIKDQYAKWRRLSPWVYIENRASGQSAIQTLRRETMIPARKFDPGTSSKVSRAQDATPFFAAGRVRLPESAPWLSAWIEEHAGFPSGRHDDQVDTTSMAVKILSNLLAVPEADPDKKEAA